MRSPSIQRDRILQSRTNRSNRVKRQRDIVTATFITGLSKTCNFLGRSIQRGNKTIECVDITEWNEYEHPINQPIYIWGLLRGGHRVLDYCIHNNVEYYYCDNSYFSTEPKSFRFTKNAMQLKTLESYNYSSLYSLNPRIQQWRNLDPNKSIIICPPSKAMSLYFGLNNWTEYVIDELRKFTNRKIEVREKPTKLGFYVKENGDIDTYDKNIAHQESIEPLSEALNRAHAIVTFNSTVFVEALQAGVPVFCDSVCSASILGNTDLKDIENPIMNNIDRWKLLNTLANNQWTKTEIEQGMSWRRDEN